MTSPSDSTDRASAPGGVQLAFDFGDWGLAADAIHRAMLRAHTARELVAAQLAKAATAVRAKRRQQLEREGVRVFLSEYDATIVIFDGKHRIYERDRDGCWRMRRRKWVMVDCPWAPFAPADLGHVDIERLVLTVRKHFHDEIIWAREINPNWRLSRHSYRLWPLKPDEPPTNPPEEWFARARRPPDLDNGKETSCP